MPTSTSCSTDLQHGPDRQYTLLDVVPLLRNASFRHAVMEQVTDPVLLSWWQYYYEPMDLRFQMEVISSVLNKLSKFASSRTTRRILGQPRSTINFTEIIRSGKILLVSTASGVVGADVSALLGATLLGLFHVTLAEQAEVARAERRQFLALIDEFQVYQGADFGTMLAGLRKYGGSFGLATQSLSYLDRLDRTLRSTVLSNVDHLFAFAMSGEDARMLHELDGIEEDDITNLDDFTCYAKVSLRRSTFAGVFAAVLIPLRQVTIDLAQRIRMQSQQRYARPCDVVDAMIAQALKRSAPSMLFFQESRVLTKTEETEEGGQNGASVVHAEAATATPTAKSGRKKHRGSGKGAAEERQEQPLSLPLVYEQLEAEGLEEDMVIETMSTHTSAPADAPGRQTHMNCWINSMQVDMRLLQWLLRYPFQRAEDLALATGSSSATVYRHLNVLHNNGLIERVMPPALGTGTCWLYHLSNLGLQVLAVHEQADPAELARSMEYG